MTNSSRSNALLLAIISTACSSLAIVFQTSAARSISPIILASISGLLGSLILFLLVRIRVGSFQVRNLSASWKDLAWLILLRNTLGAVLIWVAMELTLGIKAMFFTKVEPYFVLFWRWLLEGEKIDRKHFGLLLVHIGGAIVLSVGDFRNIGITQLGDLVLILAVLILSLSYRYGQRVARSVGTLQSGAICQGIGGMILLPFAILVGFTKGFDAPPIAWTHFLTSVILWNVIGLSAWLASLTILEGWIVSSLRALGPLIAAPISWVFFDERLTEVQLLGGVVVLGTSFLLSRERPERSVRYVGPHPRQIKLP